MPVLAFPGGGECSIDLEKEATMQLQKLLSCQNTDPVLSDIPVYQEK